MKLFIFLFGFICGGVTVALMPALFSAAPKIAERVSTTETRKMLSRVSADLAVLACEGMIKKKLKSPASYKQIEAHISNDTVIIAYDAANAFNAILRDSEICKFFKADDGTARLAGDTAVYELEICERAIDADAKRLGWSVGYHEQVSRLTCGHLRLKSLEMLYDLRDAVGPGNYPIPLTRTKLFSK